MAMEPYQSLSFTSGMATRSIRLRRDIARQRTLQSRIDVLQPCSLHWPNIDLLSQKWHQICKCHCGYVRYGNEAHNKFFIIRLEGIGMAPYSYCNAFLHSFLLSFF